MKRLTQFASRLRRAVLVRRRWLAAGAAAAAVAIALNAASAPPAPTTPVLTAARDLPGGTVVTRADLVRVDFAPDSVPTGVVQDVASLVGRTTAAPVRAGEPLTDVRLVGRSLLAGYPGLVAAPVRIPDGAMVDLLRVGDRVDLVAADPQGAREAVVVADDTVVIAIPETTEAAGPMLSGRLIVVAASEETARNLAAAGVAGYLSVVLTR